MSLVRRRDVFSSFRINAIQTNDLSKITPNPVRLIWAHDDGVKDLSPSCNDGRVVHAPKILFYVVSEFQVIPRTSHPLRVMALHKVDRVAQV